MSISNLSLSLISLLVSLSFMSQHLNSREMNGEAGFKTKSSSTDQPQPSSANIWTCQDSRMVTNQGNPPKPIQILPSKQILQREMMKLPLIMPKEWQSLQLPSQETMKTKQSLITERSKTLVTPKHPPPSKQRRELIMERQRPRAVVPTPATHQW